MMHICDITKTTLLDYPGLVACTVFTGGCNMRCVYCHNSPLVLTPYLTPGLSEEDFFSFLKKRRGVLGGVCISGGEPTLSEGLGDFMKRIRTDEPELRIKLDTNGLSPDVLSSILEERLADMVAMDIKTYPEDYPRITGIDEALTARVKESVSMIRRYADADPDHRPDYEFRTTVPSQVFTPEDFKKIGRWLEGSRAYFIQAFRDSGSCLGSGLKEPDTAELRELLTAVLPFIPAAKLRGVDDGG